MIGKMIDRGLMHMGCDRLSLTDRGSLLADQVIGELLMDWLVDLLPTKRGRGKRSLAVGDFFAFAARGSTCGSGSSGQLAALDLVRGNVCG